MAQFDRKTTEVLQSVEKRIEDMLEIIGSTNREKEVELEPQMKLPNFHGEDPEEWLRKAEDFFSINEVDDVFRFQAIGEFLEGAASQWFEWIWISFGELPWSDFRKVLVERFGKPKTLDQSVKESVDTAELKQVDAEVVNDKKDDAVMLESEIESISEDMEAGDKEDEMIEVVYEDLPISFDSEEEIRAKDEQKSEFREMEEELDGKTKESKKRTRLKKRTLRKTGSRGLEVEVDSRRMKLVETSKRRKQMKFLRLKMEKKKRSKKKSRKNKILLPDNPRKIPKFFPKSSISFSATSCRSTISSQARRCPTVRRRPYSFRPVRRRPVRRRPVRHRPVLYDLSLTLCEWRIREQATKRNGLLVGHLNQNFNTNRFNYRKSAGSLESKKRDERVREIPNSNHPSLNPLSIPSKSVLDSSNFVTSSLTSSRLVNLHQFSNTCGRSRSFWCRLGGCKNQQLGWKVAGDGTFVIPRPRLRATRANIEAVHNTRSNILELLLSKRMSAVQGKRILLLILVEFNPLIVVLLIGRRTDQALRRMDQSCCCYFGYRRTCCTIEFTSFQPWGQGCLKGVGMLGLLYVGGILVIRLTATTT